MTEEISEQSSGQSSGQSSIETYENFVKKYLNAEIKISNIKNNNEYAARDPILKVEREFDSLPRTTQNIIKQNNSEILELEESIKEIENRLNNSKIFSAVELKGLYNLVKHEKDRLQTELNKMTRSKNNIDINRRVRTVYKIKEFEYFMDQINDKGNSFSAIEFKPILERVFRAAQLARTTDDVNFLKRFINSILKIISIQLEPKKSTLKNPIHEMDSNGEIRPKELSIKEMRENVRNERGFLSAETRSSNRIGSFFYKKSEQNMTSSDRALKNILEQVTHYRYDVKERSSFWGGNQVELLGLDFEFASALVQPKKRTP